MTNGPLPSAAGPSQSTGNAEPDKPQQTQGDHRQNLLNISQLNPSFIQPYYSSAPGSGIGTPQTISSTSPQPYYYPATWNNSWPSTGYSYSPAGPSAFQPQPPYAQISYAQYQQPQVYHPQPTPQSIPPQESSKKIPAQPRPSTPSPSPPLPELHRHWDEVIKSFLTQAGLTQALRGFESDMVVMNSDFERREIPPALEKLQENLASLKSSKDGCGDEPVVNERPLEERKLDYVHLADGAEPLSKTSINKAISAYLAQNRARNDASNRTEFLQSLAQKRRRLNGDDPSGDQDVPSCARTDAKVLDRDVQMKYDIAKNEGVRLRQTMKSQDSNGPDDSQSSKEKSSRKSTNHSELSEDEDNTTSDRHPGLHDRLGNIEAHFSVRYVPSPPRTLLARLKFLEDHIIRLEKDYPPWAALHFNQPNRGWPPPPRQTPIIVPPHLRDTRHAEPFPSAIDHPAAAQTTPLQEITSGSVKSRGATSSLHRAVMERLQVKKALSDLAGGKD